MTVQSSTLAGADIFGTVEIITRRCSLTYGSAPCTASLNDASACFKTRNVLNDCQDVPNIDLENFSYFFCDADQTKAIENHRPLLKNVSIAASKIPPRGGMASVSKAKFTFIDEPDTDIETDDNIVDRSYIAREQGTFWGKFKARNSFLQGQEIRYKVSFYNSNGQLDTLSQKWQIESISWPNKNGEVTITAKDPLNLTDALNAKCPPVSRVKLFSALSTAANHIFLDSVVGIKSPDLLTILRIGDELCEVDGSTYAPQPDGSIKLNFTQNGRGILGTTHAAHAVGATVQEVARFDAMSVDAALAKIFNTYTDVTSLQLDTTGWAAQVAAWRSSNLLTNYISEPTDIKTLVSQVCDQNQVMMWYEPRTVKIKLKAVAPELGTLKSVTDANDIWDLQVQEDDTLRLNSVSMYLNPRSWIGGNKASDFEDVAVSLDTLYYDLYGQPKERNLFSRWISSSPVALSTTGVLINRFRASPFRIKFKMGYDNLNSTRLNTGDNFKLSSRQFQDGTGAPYAPEFICISTKYDKDMNLNVEAVAYSYFAGNNAAIGASSFDGQDYSTYIAANPENGGVLAWISQADGTMVNGDDAYYIT
tara:strand:- start:2573 stop:4345 length:1773 start_codon:yes stop_codon:yes gene_type:complete